jgi:hypothetical protein
LWERQEAPLKSRSLLLADGRRGWRGRRWGCADFILDTAHGERGADEPRDEISVVGHVPKEHLRLGWGR